MAWAMALPLGAELLRGPEEYLEGVPLRLPSLRGVVALPPPDSLEGTRRSGSIERRDGEEAGGGVWSRPPWPNECDCWTLQWGRSSREPSRADVCFVLMLIVLYRSYLYRVPPTLKFIHYGGHLALLGSLHPEDRSAEPGTESAVSPSHVRRAAQARLSPRPELFSPALRLVNSPTRSLLSMRRHLRVLDLPRLPAHRLLEVCQLPRPRALRD